MLVYTPTGSYALRSGVTIPLFEKVFRSKPRSREVDVVTKVVCPPRYVKVLDFSEVSDRLAQQDIAIQNIFLRVRWNNGELLCPAHYINYPTSETDQNYVQPISGPVCIRISGKIRNAYLVIRLHEQGMTQIEFVARRPVTPISVGRGLESFSRFSSFFSLLSLVRVDEYSEVLPVEGSCEFFEYR